MFWESTRNDKVSSFNAPPTALSLLALASFGFAACQGEIGDPTRRGRGPGQVTQPQCTIPISARNPIRRLTPEQYRRSVSLLFEGVALPQLDFFGSTLAGGFDNNVDGQGTTDQVVAQYATAAEDIAAAAMANTSWMSCGVGDPGCLQQTATDLAERAYRRPLTDEESNWFQQFVADQEGVFGATDTLAILIEGLLQSPQFLYLPETGIATREAPNGQIALQDIELASRMSYLLWNEPPDEELQRVARDGTLHTDAVLSEQIDRLMADPRFEEAMETFFTGWLELDELEAGTVDSGLYPEFYQPGVREDLQRSAQRFLHEAFFDGGSMEEVFTSRSAYVNDRIAPFFGVDAPGSGESLVAVELPPEERSGILTHPAVLASTSHGTSHAPILRGVLVLDKVLCDRPPPPPPNVMTQEGEAGPVGERVTTRQKIENGHGTEECAVCHEAIDGMGFSFENFDAVGRFRTMENGLPVDPTGSLRGQEVADAMALSAQLGSDEGVGECVTVQMLEMALARYTVSNDYCQITELTETLQSSGNLTELFRSLLMSNAFRYAPTNSE